MTVKKEGWGGGGTRTLTFTPGDSEFPALKPAGKTLNVSIARGLPKDTSKSATQISGLYMFFSSTARKPFYVHNITSKNGIRTLLKGRRALKPKLKENHKY